LIQSTPIFRDFIKELRHDLKRSPKYSRSMDSKAGVELTNMKMKKCDGDERSSLVMEDEDVVLKRDP